MKNEPQEFFKLCGTGNDFVVIDNRDGKIRNKAKLAQRVCPRHIGIGADGLILLEKSDKAALKMRIYNSDGSEAEMCGNGMRCAAWAAHHIMGMNKKIDFETIAGIIKGNVSGNIVKVQLSDPLDYRDYSPIEVADGIFYFYFINTGVPHCVIFEDNIDDIDVDRLGREIRHHEHFEPHGANVNFVEVVDSGSIKVRTYERGVESETLACGTGSTASAIISALIEKCDSPVNVTTRSGEKLTIHFDVSMYDIKNVFLEGAVSFVYKGSFF